MASSISAGTTSSTALVATADTTGALQLASNNGTVAVTINASQNVGIGTTSPGAKLDVAGGVNVSGQLLAGTSGSVFAPLVNAAYVPGTSNMYIRNLSGVNRIDSYNDPITATYPFQINASQQAFLIADTEQMRIASSGNLQFNSGYGSVATAYGCRAWVNFNGTDTVAIRASGNVSSITDNGTGDYTANFTTAMPDANYSTSGMCVNTTSDAGTWLRFVSYVGVPLQTTSFRVKTSHPSLSPEDCVLVTLAVFR